MFCNSWCNNNSTNFNNNSCPCNRNNSCGCRSCGCNSWGSGRSGCGCNNSWGNFRSGGCGCNNGCGNFNNGDCGCNQCGQRSNNGCGWYTCPCGSNNFFWLPSTVSNQVPPTTRTINIGYFTNPSATSIATDGIIPLTLSRQIGSQITSSGTGALLPTGVYDVSYSLSGTPTAAPDPAPGTAAVGVKLNGNTVPIFTQSASTTSTANPYNISSHGILEVTSPSSILTLNNLGEETQNFTDINLVIRKLA